MKNGLKTQTVLEVDGFAILKKGNDSRGAKGRGLDTEAAMDSWLQAILVPPVKRGLRRSYLYGSDAGFCARRNVLLERSEVLDSNINSAGLGYMGIGVAFENILAQSLRENQRLIKQDYRILEQPEIKISGKGDLLVLDDQEQVALLEVKTCGELPEEPKPQHLAQIQTYAAYSGIRNCWLVYMSRNLKPIAPIPVRSFKVDTKEDALINRLRIAFLSRLSAQAARLAPVPLEFRKHTECHYCEFRDFYCYQSRPGLGSEMPLPLLETLSPSEYLTLNEEAKTKAELLHQNIEYMYYDTLRDIYNIYTNTNNILDTKVVEILGRSIEDQRSIVTFTSA